MMLSPVNRANIRVANGENHARDVVAIEIDHGVEAERVVTCDPFAFATEAVPEVDKCLSEVARLWPNNPQVGVAPLRGIKRSHIVTADKRGNTIDYQQLAMIQPVASRIEQMPG